MGWEEKAAKAKRGHRPSLKNWERDGFASTFPPYADALLSSDRPYSMFKVVSGGDSDNSGDVQSRRDRGRATKKKVVVERSFSLRSLRRAVDSDSGAVGGDEGGVTGGMSRLWYGSVGGNNRRRRPSTFPIVLDAEDVSPAEFHERYEARCFPAVIRNIPYGAGRSDCHRALGSGGGSDGNVDAMAMDEEEKKECDGQTALGNHRNANRSDGGGEGVEWPAVRRWTLESLASDPDLSASALKCGEDDDGYTIRMRLGYFLQYLRNNRDDSPLYIFDATFDEDKRANRLLGHYTVPSYFNEDLLGLVGERRRPPYRWFLVGPARSGTTVHIDPLGTSAWNTLVHGAKRWVLFPPHVPKSVVKGRKLVLPGEDDEAIHYFTTILPRMKRRAAAVAAAAGEDNGGADARVDSPYSDFECYEFTQFPGETVFVPHGWWHAVLNITDTVGITQNFCSRRNFDEVWTQTRRGRKKLACTWLRRLDASYPDLAERARELNRRDGFVMWEDDPMEQAKWRKKKAERERKKRERKERKKRKGEKGKGREAERGKQRQEQEKPSKKEKWGEHRAADRRREVVIDTAG